MEKEIDRVALRSVAAAFFLTSFKLLIGYFIRKFRNIVRSIAFWIEFNCCNISFKIGKPSVNDLLNKDPDESCEQIIELIQELEDIRVFHDLKIRTSGADSFVLVTIDKKTELNIVEAYEIAISDEQKIKDLKPRSYV